MDQVDAYRLLDEKVRAWQEFDFHDLKDLVGQTVSDIAQRSGQNYKIESTVILSDDNEILIDLMVATEGSGLLQRIDRTITIRTV